MDNEKAARLIVECLDENLFEPQKDWPIDVFEERSYARWAAMEIWQMLMDRPHEEADAIIEEFMLKMAIYSECVEDARKRRIFRIAKNTAEDILTLF